MSDDTHAKRATRRELLAAGLAAAASYSIAPRAVAQSPQRAPQPEPTPAQLAAALPLDTLGLEHIGTVVPDVARAARFYSSVFNPALYKERDEPLRYYVTLDPGYIALGGRANETRAFIDHDCALLRTYDRVAVARRLEADGLPAGRFGIIPDPDGLGLQLLAVPGGLAGSTVPAGRLVEREPVVRPRGLAYVVRYVADLERSAAFYRRFFGAEMADDEGGGIAFRAAHTRWILRRAAAGEAPRIDRFGVHVAHYDTPAVTRGLETLGARVLSATPQRIHFRCPDGLGVELNAVDPARIWGLA
jgi:catechol 2,3-dioxygenase-like lactoylglutathione lyase family enzyme